MGKDLGDPIDVPFDRMHLDPNNPRLGRERAGYDDPEEIFPADVQKKLEASMTEAYPQLGDLEENILTQGWVPVDSILVWEHPKKKQHYVVVEGNSRTTALRNIRASYGKLKEQHDKHEKKKDFDKSELAREAAQLKIYENLIESTSTLRVLPVLATSSDDLQDKLPRLLGVRHISHAQTWGPYPRNLYITSLYKKKFHEKNGASATLKLDADLVRQVAEVVSQNDLKTRRNIQAAVAFERFKNRYEDELPVGEKFSDEDHYFFELILQNKYPQEQLGFEKDALELPKEKEKVLFQWAFSKPRPAGKENPNILHIAEDIRLWHTLKKYDDKHGTRFANGLDVEDPAKATPMVQIEADYMTHKARQSPTDVLQSLVKAFEELRVDTLRSEKLHIQPLLKEIVNRGADYLKMLGAVGKAGK